MTGTTGLGIINNAAIGVTDGRIAYIGAENALPAGSDYVFDQGGVFATPALIDCHTHLIYAGSRAEEYTRRLNGESYEDIAKAGGGILSTVRATRAASAEELETLALKRIRALFQDGVAGFEIKSGYGLDLASEEKMLRVATSLRDGLGLPVQRTFLAAHALPPEFAGRTDDYIAHVCDVILPHCAAGGLIDAVDAFCEKIAFSTAQIQKLFAAAKKLGLPVKIHAEQRSNIGASALAASFGALSSDHIEYIGENDIKALAKSGTVATLLPGAYYTLRETQKPPVELLRKYSVPMAVATDHNPGTSPLLSLRTAMNMAVYMFGLSAEEALRGGTVNAAKALGWKDRGTLAPGMIADIAFWRADDVRDIVYTLAGRPCTGLYVAGNHHDFTA
ncbi:MAG: imidazolonepropionase [Bdellovibrionales bacterium]